MTEIHPFKGSIICVALSELGEGPNYHPATDTLWWLNILGEELHQLHLGTGTKTVHRLGMKASIVSHIDTARQLIVSDQGIFVRDIATGAMTFHAAVEPEKPGNRSNDGRVHPCGALWTSTMGRKAEDLAGSIYHVARGVVTPLFDNISIPNGISFSPDGSVGYFVDSRVNRMMRVTLDPVTGLPTGTPSVLIDASGEPSFDGAVVDADGFIWSARWGAGAVDRLSPDGLHLDRYLVPALQTSCPAFAGPQADRMLVTSAWEGMDTATRGTDPHAGSTFDLGIRVKGVHEPAYAL